MSKKLRTRKGIDGYNYPYTHEDLIFNDEGTSLSQQLENFATKDFVNESINNGPDSSAINAELEKKVNKSDLAAVATSGSYDDLINKPDKLIYKDTTIDYKRIESESSINSFDMEEGIIFCVIESLNLEEGKTYNVKALVEYTTSMSLNEPESLVDNTILIELEGVAEKSEELSSFLGTDVISLSFSLYDYLDEENVIVIYDKVTINSVDSPLSYAEDRAVVAFADNIHYIDIGLKENIESEVTNEFLETYKFVTEEEKINWNNKQDKIKNSVFIKQTPSPDTYDYNEINLVLNTLEDGLYMATNDLSFYDETTLLEGGAELYNGKKECSFDIYAGHLFKYEKYENVDITAYCYITNLTTGIGCSLDKNGGIIAIYAANGFMYLDDVEKMLQYEEVVLELYESDRTGTTVMGTSSREYQFNNAGFLFNENEIYHVIFEDLDGKKTEITGKAVDDGTFFGNTILAISEWDNPLTPETYLGSDGTSMIFNIDVKNSLEYNGFGKVTILKVEYISTEFLETHRFVTEEEKANWNNKLEVEDLPCYDNRVFEDYSIEYDGNGEGKEEGYIQAGPYAYSYFKKLADLSEEEYDTYKLSLSTGYAITYEDYYDKTLKTVESDSIYEDDARGLLMLEGQYIVITRGTVEVTGGSYGGNMIFPSAGIYFENSTRKFDFKNSTGELKTLDKKFLPSVVGETVEIGTTHGDVTDDENTIYTTQKGAEIFNNYDDNVATGMYSHAEGNGSSAFGDYSHAEGEYTVASGKGSHAEGEQCRARGEYSHVEGSFSQAVGTGSHAEGKFSNANGYYSHAEGGSTQAIGDCSHTEGNGTEAYGFASHAEGNDTIASGDYQHVQGKHNIEDTEKIYAHIVGNGRSSDYRNNAHTLDWDGNAWFAGKVTASVQPTDNNDLTTKEYVDNAIAQASIGGEIDATEFALKSELFSKDYNDLTNKPFYDTREYEDVVIEYDGNTEGRTICSLPALGMRTAYKVADLTAEQLELYSSSCANGFTLTYLKEDGSTEVTQSSIVHSFMGTSKYLYAGGLGQVFLAVEPFSTEIGHADNYVNEAGIYFKENTGTNPYKVVKLEFQNTIGELKIIEPQFLTNSPGIKVEEGKSYISQYNSQTYVSQNNAEIFNDTHNIATGQYSHAEGTMTEAHGNYSHAEGNGTTAIGEYSHAEGAHTQATGRASHSEGWSTTASGWYSHAEGTSTTAEGDSSHAEGNFNYAIGDNSHVEGTYNKAHGDCQHVQGKHAIPDEEGRYAHIVGNGEYAQNREKDSNAHTLDWDGNAWFAGDVFIKGTSQDDAQKLATEEFVNDAIAQASIGGESGFSGDYNDLENKPEIPTVTNDLTDELKANYDTAYERSESGEMKMYCIDGFSGSLLASHSPSQDRGNAVFYSTKAYITSSGSIGTDGNINAKAFYEDGAALIDKYATKTYVDDAILGASNNLQEQINNLFQNVSNGKELIASAITDKGIDASEDETFQELADKISSIIVGPPGSTIVGYVDEENDIYISQTEVGSGTYILKYEDQNGILTGFDDIGNVEVE